MAEIEIDHYTFRLLSEMAAETGATVSETIAAAAVVLKHENLGRQVQHAIGELQKDPLAWASYLADGELPNPLEHF